jgi:hypothetical protein
MGKRVSKFETSLRAAFPDVAETDMLLALRLIRLWHSDQPTELRHAMSIIPAVQELERQCYNLPGRHYSLMTALNALLGTHGSEPLGEVHMCYGPPFEYLNVGDPYIPTLVYYRSSGRFYVRCYGDLVEAYRLK